ncbi:MAG TPA: FKBP-type peptidyl-prolyl cis-trans isomerase [Candidatus Paceibacterota bacterium]|nr:FKBP-type peptidyl-prolyl cis-trans isomerase [Candidatus Paceibacterota bacterium]
MQNKKGNIGVIVSFIIVVCLIGLIVYALLYKGPEYNPSRISNNNGNSLEQTAGNENTIANQTATPQKKSMEQTAKNGDTLVMNYTGRLTNGTVFDSNVDPKFGHVEPFTFVLGAGQVIKGWDEGLVGMKVGEKKTLTIPPEKGYGAQAVGSIPANSTLIFDVELVAIK